MKKMFFVLILVMASYLYAFNPNPVNPGENPITPGENPINPGENPINPGGHPINGNPIIPIEINPIIIGGELKMPCIAFINGWSCHQVPNRVCVKSSKGDTCVCRDGFKEDKYDYKHASLP